MTRCYMQGQHELLEVNSAGPVGVESSEDILAELVRISAWEHFGVHQNKLIFTELSIGRVLQESFVPFLKC